MTRHGPRFTEYLPCPRRVAPDTSVQEVVGLEGVGVNLHNGASIIRDISFSVTQGDFALIKGSSGSGKSTILRTIANIQKPDTGQVRIFGENVGQKKKRQIDHLFRRIGIGFQSPALKKGWSVFDNLVYYSEINGTADKSTNRRAAAILSEFGLLGKAELDAATLSGGEQQKIELGSLLLGRPELLLLDEPTASMDGPSKHHTLSLLQQLALEGTTIVMVSHDEQPADYVNRLIRVEDGQVVSDYYRDLISSPVSIE